MNGRKHAVHLVLTLQPGVKALKRNNKFASKAFIAKIAVTLKKVIFENSTSAANNRKIGKAFKI